LNPPEKQMEIRVGDVFENPRALGGWTLLEVLAEPGPEDDVVEVKPLKPLEFWDEKTYGLARISQLKRNYKKVQKTTPPGEEAEGRPMKKEFGMSEPGFSVPQGEEEGK
jgi:hypothetical protein